MSSMKQMIAVFCLLAVVALVHAASKQEYCNVCQDHTKCLYQCNIKPGSECSKIKQTPLSDAEKRDLLQIHNDLRNRIAKGQVAGQPIATNMRELVWDNELADIAQCWANQCQAGHDTCRNLVSGEWVGQNFAATGSSSRDGAAKTPMKKFVNMWFDEHKNFRYNMNEDELNQTFAKIGHYTQLAWAETNRIGCGRVMTWKDGFHWQYLYCNYAVAGNNFAEVVYKTGGGAASDCEHGRSGNYPGLCK